MGDTRDIYKDFFDKDSVTDIGIGKAVDYAINIVHCRLDRKWNKDAWKRKWFYHMTKDSIDLQNSFMAERPINMENWNMHMGRGIITFNPDEEVYMGDGWIKRIKDANN
jgi:hypothetical protein